MAKINLKKLKLTGSSAASGGEIAYIHNEPVSSNLDPLDLIIGGGLFPGRIYLLSGEKSSGKSTLMQQCMAGFQKGGGVCAHAESETTLELDRAESFGVDLDALLLSNESINILEDGFEWLKNALLSLRDLDSNVPIMLTWDTYQSTITRAQFASTKPGQKSVEGLRKEMDQFAGGRQEEARIIKTKLKELVHILNKNKGFLLLLSQVYENTDMFSSEKLVASGGHGLNHQVSTHIRVERKSKIYHKVHDKIVVGHMVKLYTMKNKQAPPSFSMDIPLFFNTGFSSGMALHKFCVDHGLATGGPWTHLDNPFGIKDGKGNKKFQLKAMFGQYCATMEDYGIYHWMFILICRFYGEIFPTIEGRYTKMADEREKLIKAKLESGEMKLFPETPIKD